MPIVMKLTETYLFRVNSETQSYTRNYLRLSRKLETKKDKR